MANLVSAQPVREHIEGLSMMGASYRAIADQSAVSVQQIVAIVNGQRSVYPDVAHAILRVTPESLFDRSGDRDFVLDVGVRRRLRALLALGHNAVTIGGVIGKDDRWVYNRINQPGRWCSREVWELVRTAYEALAMTPGSSAHTRGRAKRLGYLPPMAWEEDELDDPNAEPHMPEDGEGDVDEVALLRVLDGTTCDLDRKTRLAALPTLVARGKSDSEIARLVGVTERQVLRDRQHLNLEPAIPKMTAGSGISARPRRRTA